jgi:hypothetical protein
MVFKDIEIRIGRFSQPASAIEKPDAQSRVVTGKFRVVRRQAMAGITLSAHQPNYDDD